MVLQASLAIATAVVMGHAQGDRTERALAFGRAVEAICPESMPYELPLTLFVMNGMDH